MEFKIASGQTIQISDEDYDYVNQFQWHRYQGKYVCYQKKNKRFFLNVEIGKRMGLGKVRFLSGDHFDFRRLNLGVMSPTDYIQHKPNGFYHVYVPVRKYIGRSKNLNTAIKIRDKYFEIGEDSKHKNVTGEKYIHMCRKKYTVRYKKEYYGMFESLEEAIEMRDSILEG